MLKNLISSKFLERKDIKKIINYSRDAEKGRIPNIGKKVLGLLFLEESLRAEASLKAASIKLGGGYVEFDKTYFAKKEESLEDTIKAAASICDVLAIRGGADIDLSKFRDIGTPIINAMWGKDYLLNGLWLLYSYTKRTNIKGKKIGVYGIPAHSRLTYALYYLFSNYNVTFYEDAVTKESSTKNEVIKYIEKKGSKFERKKISEFIGNVDLLFITEGLPLEGEKRKEIREINEKFEQISKEDIEKMKRNSYFVYIMPRKLPNGRLTASREVDKSKKLLTYKTIKEGIYANIGMLRWLLS